MKSLNLVDLKGRTHGNMRFIDVTVTVNPHLNVHESHKITEKIEHTVKHLTRIVWCSSISSHMSFFKHTENDYHF